MPRNKHHTKRTNKAHEVVNLETITDQHKKNVTHHEAVSSSSESTEHWNDQLPDELFSIIIAFCDCFDYTQLVLVSKHMNQLCKKFIPLDIACKKAFMGSLTYEEFITLPLFIQQHRSLHKNLLCQHPKKVSFLLFPNRMTTNTTTTDHHHFEILSNNDDMKNYCLNYALVSAFYQNNKYLSNSWHGFHNLMSLKGVFPHTQKLVSDLAKSIDPRLLFNSSFRKFFVELAEVLANIRSTFQNEKELLSYFSMASSSSVNVEYAKCWFFSKGHESNYGLLEFAPPNIKNDKRMIMACLERFYTKYQSL
ncbi:hypothetical protein C9374_007264 [Naegleria lovaniensis]|uniref:F-box domain-containing protein n=1 Tax=Naegleria lovaniensis TaxID=51637 RepID=A0AA88H385_NAELO|nr:uncharacterized protein C9374_007264 [Naegleria lovaniensis]KAG2393733.1 hypothetical protein C9374_007264 [Naegleria lovaniensis]